jgi:hypothetical protein
MARTSLFVRPLERSEMKFLGHLRKSRRHALRQRAEILLASMVYTPVYQIALIFRTDEAYVRKVIHAFNEFGFERLNPKVGTGRPKTFEPAIRDQLVAIALAPPTTLGEPLTRWSLRRLKSYVERRKIVPSISVETLRSILRETSPFSAPALGSAAPTHCSRKRPPVCWQLRTPDERQFRAMPVRTASLSPVEPPLLPASRSTHLGVARVLHPGGKRPAPHSVHGVAAVHLEWCSLSDWPDLPPLATT